MIPLLEVLAIADSKRVIIQTKIMRIIIIPINLIYRAL